jgi:D-beta-D-heptose 7-phosphate kinase/D-beta-D-heptose 1-phosphate adenosyltransferase
MIFKKGRSASGIGSKSNLKGMIFGYLTPLELEPGIIDGGYIWVCKCHCGNTKIVPARYLLRGDTKSCGCLRIRTIRERCWNGFGDISMDLWSSIKNGASQRNIEFNVSIEHAWILFLKQNRCCALTNRKLTFKTRSQGYGNVSLDRIDSSIGYIYGNLQWVYKDINLLKNKFDETTLIDFCEKIFINSQLKYNYDKINDSYLTDEFLIKRYKYSKKTIKTSKKKWRGLGELSLEYYRSIKRGAEDRGLSFDINIEDIWELYLKQGGRCNLSGGKIYFSRNRKKHKQTASVDRIDSSLGYQKDNIQIVHKHINIMKHTFSQDMFITYATEIFKNKDIDKFPIESIALSGGFDCPHKGHYRMFKDASSFGLVITILNSDKWLMRKKGYVFMDYEERREILEACKYIDVVIIADDDDDSVCNTLKSIRTDFFGNGGDRKSNNTPEVKLCKELDISLIWNVGGGKIQSSSELVDNMKK